jgi:hypothetical protein
MKVLQLPPPSPRERRSAKKVLLLPPPAKLGSATASACCTGIAQRRATAGANDSAAEHSERHMSLRAAK